MGKLFACGPVRCLRLLSIPQMSGLLCIVSSARCSVASCSDLLPRPRFFSFLVAYVEADKSVGNKAL